jgi:pyruvate formate lyase activating enzyme
MLDHDSTPLATLEKAWQAATDAGLRYVYLGNVPGNKHEDTWCPGCHSLLIKRAGFGVVSNFITKDKKCPKCGESIAVIM